MAVGLPLSADRLTRITVAPATLVNPVPCFSSIVTRAVRCDYDFSTASRDSTMGKGVIARTVVFDELVKNFIEKNPDCTVVNIACGLDTRFYRMDNGKITWYNLDLPETIAIRNQIFEESGRVS